jgi:hypothetical protein
MLEVRCSPELDFRFPRFCFQLLPRPLISDLRLLLFAFRFPLFPRPVVRSPVVSQSNFRFQRFCFPLLPRPLISDLRPLWFDFSFHNAPILRESLGQMLSH